MRAHRRGDTATAIAHFDCKLSPYLVPHKVTRIDALRKFNPDYKLRDQGLLDADWDSDQLADEAPPRRIGPS
jgi:hypothetical protein